MAGLSQPMGAFLQRRRNELNRLFQEVHQTHPGLTPEGVVFFLSQSLDGVVQSLASYPHQQGDEVAETLYAMALPLIARGWLGGEARSPELAKGWGELLQANVHLLLEDVEQVAGGVLNALYHLDSFVGSNGISYWVKEMIRLGPLCPNPALFMDLGRVLAWQAGLAHYRQTALPLLAVLPPSLMIEIWGKPLTREDYQRLLVDPWWRVGEESARGIRLMGRVGGFRGFGGPFLRPPRLFFHQGQVFAGDGEVFFAVFADAWGATLLPVGKGEETSFMPARGGMATLTPQGMVEWGHEQQFFPPAVASTSCWANDHTCVVTVNHSHHVVIFAQGVAYV